jgi:hypothetical protein
MSKFAAMAIAATVVRLALQRPDGNGPLADANGEPAWIDLLPADSPQGQAANRAAIDRRLSSRRGKMKAEDLDRDGTDMLAALTKGWRLVALDGSPLDVPCTTANAAELYAMPEMGWLRRQVDEFVSDAGNFLRV